MTLPIFTKRMLDLMAFAVANNLNKCTKDEDFLKSIGFAHASNISNVKNGSQGFRNNHYLNAIKIYDIDANFFYRKECTDMFMGSSKYNTPLTKLKEAVDLITKDYNEVFAVDKPAKKIVKSRSKSSQKKL